MTEILDQDYVFGSKVKLSTKTDNGLTYTLTGSSLPKSDNLKGEFSIKGTKVNYTKDRTQELSLGTTLFSSIPPMAEAGFELSDSLGSNVGITAIGSNSFALVTTKIIRPKLGIFVTLDALNLTANTSLASAIAPSGYGGYAVLGAKGLIDLSKGTVSDGRVAASLFDGKESEVTLEIEGQVNAATVSYSHLVRPSTSFAASMRYSKADASHVGAMGIATKLDPSNTLKAKLDTAGQAGLSIIQHVHPSTEIVFSTQFDLAKFDTPKVGLSVTLS